MKVELQLLKASSEGQSVQEVLKREGRSHRLNIGSGLWSVYSVDIDRTESCDGGSLIFVPNVYAESLRGR